MSQLAMCSCLLVRRVRLRRCPCLLLLLPSWLSWLSFGQIGTGGNHTLSVMDLTYSVQITDKDSKVRRRREDESGQGKGISES